MEFIDLSHPIEKGMPTYPGDPPVQLRQAKYLASDGFNNYQLSTGMHSGTHVDSPMHLAGGRSYISEIPLESFAGLACVLDVRGQKILSPKPEYPELIRNHSIVLLYTGFDVFYETREYYTSHPCMDKEFCELLLRHKVNTLGLDAPSPDRYPFEIHKFLLNKNVLILENLRNLDKLLNVAKFEVMAFPLKIRADSSMTRAVARVLSHD